MRTIVLLSSIIAIVCLPTSFASAQLSAIACSGDSRHPCPSLGSDFFAPTQKKKHASPDLIATNYCNGKWSGAGKPPGRAKATVLGLDMPGGCCGYRLIRIDCFD